MSRSRPPCLRLLGAALLGVAIGVSGCGDRPDPDPAAARPARTNLLFVTLDTTRADVLTPYGGDALVSPHLAALAARSAVFVDAYSETNLTNPSHVTLFSGLRAIDHGVIGNAMPVPERVDTLAEALHRAGYRTAGFPAAPHLVKQTRWRGFDHIQPTNVPLEATTITDDAVAWIRANADAPFFAWVHYYDPHAIYHPPGADAALLYAGDPHGGNGPLVTDAEYFRDGVRHDPFIRSVARWLEGVRDPGYAPAMYKAEVRYVDRMLGQLLWELDQLGLSDRTIVVVVADHGESLGEHGMYYSHRGLHEQELRIPLLFHVPGLPALRSDAFVTTLDVAPTLSELLGVTLRNDAEGRSLVPILEARPDARLEAPDAFVHQSAHNEVIAVRRGAWKLILPLVENHWLLSRGAELYDLGADPQESTNLAARDPERVEAMRDQAARWLKLGPRPQALGRLSEEDRESLRVLGYLEDDAPE